MKSWKTTAAGIAAIIAAIALAISHQCPHDRAYVHLIQPHHSEHEIIDTRQGTVADSCTRAHKLQGKVGDRVILGVHRAPVARAAPRILLRGRSRPLRNCLPSSRAPRGPGRQAQVRSEARLR